MDEKVGVSERPRETRHNDGINTSTVNPLSNPNNHREIEQNLFDLSRLPVFRGQGLQNLLLFLCFCFPVFLLG